MAPHISKDLLAARLATRQHGNITRAQLLDAGFKDHGIARRVRLGQLHRVFPGVYSVGRPPQLALERAAAVVLAAGPTAALSHFAALALWDLAGWPATINEVVVSTDRRPRGVRVHLCATLLPRDIRRRHGIRVTSPARAILDCAPNLTDPQLIRIVNDARHAKHLKLPNLADLILRCPTHRGAARLKPFLEHDSGISRSELEDVFQRLIKDHNLPQPRLNVPMGEYVADCYFEAHQLIVEIDSWDFHRSRSSFERDRSRDADIYETRGIPTIRLTYERMKRQPAREADRLERILARRAAELSLGSQPARRSGRP
jgi:very-short-patch-repair endonuclease